MGVHCPSSTAGATGAVALAQAFNVVLVSGVTQQITWSGAFWTSDATIIKTRPNFNNTDQIVSLEQSGQWLASMRTEGYTGAIAGLSGDIEPTLFTIADGDFANSVVLDTTVSGSKEIGAWCHGFYKHFSGSQMQLVVKLRQSSGANQTVTQVSLFVNFLTSPTDVTQEW